MAVKSLAAASAKFRANFGQGVAAGVDTVTVAPGTKAAAARDLWQRQISRPETVEKWARNVAATSLAEWQMSMKTKGVANMANASQRATQKWDRWWGAARSVVQSEVDGLPARKAKGQNKERSTVMQDAMMVKTTRAALGLAV